MVENQYREQLTKEFRDSLPEMQKQYDALIQYVKEHKDAFDMQRFISPETWAIIRESEKKIKELTCDNWHGQGEFIFQQARAFERYIEDKTGDELDCLWCDGNVCLHHFTGTTPEHMIQEQVVRMASDAHVWLSDFVTINNGQVEASQRFERHGVSERNEKDALFIKDNLFDNIRKRFENIVAAHNLIKDFTQNQTEQCKAHYAIELDKAQIYHEDMQKRNKAAMVEDERKRKLKELTSSLPNTKSFDEIITMAKEIKDLKDKTRDDTYKHLVGNNRGGIEI